MKWEKSISRPVIYSYSFYDSHLWLNLRHWLVIHQGTKRREKKSVDHLKNRISKKNQTKTKQKLDYDVENEQLLICYFFPETERKWFNFINPKMLLVSHNIGRIYLLKCQLYIQEEPKYQKIKITYLKNLYTSREKIIIPNHVHFTCIPQPPSLRMRKYTKFLFSWVQD